MAAVEFNDIEAVTVFEAINGKDQGGLGPAETQGKSCLRCRCHGLPFRHRLSAENSKCATADEVTVDVEQIVDMAVNGEKSLGRTLRFESLHLSFSSSSWYVRTLSPIVASRPAFSCPHQCLPCPTSPVIQGEFLKLSIPALSSRPVVFTVPSGSPPGLVHELALPGHVLDTCWRSRSATNTPRQDTKVTSPADSSRSNASRTGVRDTLSQPAISVSRIRSQD